MEVFLIILFLDFIWNAINYCKFSCLTQNPSPDRSKNPFVPGFGTKD